MPKPVGRPRIEADKRKDVQISVRLRRSTLAALQKEAAQNGVPLASEICYRLEDSLAVAPNQPPHLGGAKNQYFGQLLGLSLKHLRDLTGHWWHEDPFTFQHAKMAAETLFEYCKPKGRVVTPDDLPARAPGQVRRVSFGKSHRKTAFGAEAAATLIAAIEAYSGTFGAQYEKLIPSAQENHRAGMIYNLGIYRRIGRAILPLHARRKNRAHPGIVTSNKR